MKTVYFVRHGESEANVNVENSSGVFQGNLSPLTDKGKEQARFIAARCGKLPVDVILSSSATRAHDTALEIQRAIGKTLEVNALFVERQPPTMLMGKSRSDPTMKAILERWHESFYVENMRVEDGENFEDLKSRVCDALQYLSKRAEQHIVVATHGFFLHMLISVVMLGERLTQEEFTRAACKVWMNNTGITQIDFFTAQDNKFLDGKPYDGWVLRVWNDHAHLG